VDDQRVREGEPACFGCSVTVQGGRRKPNRAQWLVGDKQGHVTVECSRHARLILDASVGGVAWAIPLVSLCVVTDAETIGDALLNAAQEQEAPAVGNKRCPTYVRGFTLDLLPSDRP
jgi:hypothetical protein